MTAGEDLWVIDTSSLIEIKQVVLRSSLKPVLIGMTGLVDKSGLIYPREVIKELAAYKNKHKLDPPYEWAKNNEPKAANHDNLFADIAILLKNKPQLATVLDSSKTDGIEEADLYVLALAVRNKAQFTNVVVVTEESRQRPDRMPLSVACGVMRIYHCNVKAFLQETKIWPGEPGQSRKGPPSG
jgi:rRNA maturation endonuclease Nob1